MSPLAIKAEHLAKQYSIGARDAPYRTLRDAIASAAMALSSLSVVGNSLRLRNFTPNLTG